MHLTLVPFIAAAGELKTKPTQHSVKELRSIGIQPDVLLCRSEQPLPDGERRKIALFTNVPEKAVISAVDLDNIYKLPQWFHEQGLDAIVLDRLRIQAGPAELGEWNEVVDASTHPVDEVTIAVVGKYIDHQDAYKSLAEALKHGGLRQRTKVTLKWLESSEVERHGVDALAGVDGILVPGGFGDRGFEGKVATAKYARENKVPYFGICYGMRSTRFLSTGRPRLSTNSLPPPRPLPWMMRTQPTSWVRASLRKARSSASASRTGLPCRSNSSCAEISPRRSRANTFGGSSSRR